jgi:hypothetical protein
MLSARGVKSRCGFHILQQKVRFAASLQVVAVDLRRRKFRKLLFRHRNRCSLFIERIDNGAPSIRPESTREWAQNPAFGASPDDLGAKSGLFKTA